MVEVGTHLKKEHFDFEYNIFEGHPKSHHRFFEVPPTVELYCDQSEAAFNVKSTGCSTPRRWSCLFHLLGRDAPLLSPATPKPVSWATIVLARDWEESFHLSIFLRENPKKNVSKFPRSEKRKPEFLCPQSPRLIASQECKIYLL